VNKLRLVHNLRLGTALLFVALEFTNVVPYLAEWSNKDSQFSRYPLQFAGYGVCLLVLLFDRRNVWRLLHKRITLWAAALLVLLSWAMIIRMFNSPADVSDYLLFRAFGVQVNSIGFLLTCVVIFDDAIVLKLTKQAIVVATLGSVVLVVSDVLFASLHFSNISGRGAGLYVQPNSAGMAIVFGCLIGIKTIRRGWPKDLFVMTCVVGVVATFSRQAALSLAVILVAGSLGRALSLRRLLLVGVAGMALFTAKNLASTFADKDILTNDTRARLSLDWSDSSTMDRSRLAYKTLEKFEDAPLLGQGFGTTNYWADEPSHNAYLNFMADCGIVGALVIPGLVLSVRRKTWDSNAFSAMFLVWGLVSHLVLTELFALITIAVLVDEPAAAEEDRPRPLNQRVWIGSYAAGDIDGRGYFRRGDEYVGGEGHLAGSVSRAGVPE
jgi:hypothetical protein